MSLCIIKYTYTRYVGVDIEKYTRGLFEYVKEEFGEFQPQMSEPGTIPDMPDYLDIVLCKKAEASSTKWISKDVPSTSRSTFSWKDWSWKSTSPTVMEQNTKRYTTLSEGKLQKSD